MEYSILSGQDIFDVSIQNFGDIETGLLSILENKNININLNLTPGTVISINNENSGDVKLKSYIKNRKLTLNNASADEITKKTGDFNGDFNNDFS